MLLQMCLGVNILHRYAIDAEYIRRSVRSCIHPSAWRTGQFHIELYTPIFLGSQSFQSIQLLCFLVRHDAIFVIELFISRNATGLEDFCLPNWEVKRSVTPLTLVQFRVHNGDICLV
ncbi:hypothetical protein D3C80_1323570 [compost metagenome]